MRKRVFIWILLQVLLMASCSLIDEQPRMDNCPELSIAIEFPENYLPQTRATVGEVPGESEENAIHDLAIWVFYTAGEKAHQKVASLMVDKTETDSLPTAGGVRKYALQVDQTFVQTRPKVDVFVLVNRESIDSQLTEDSSYDDVNGAIFGGQGYFSPDGTRTTSVPENGLPMSGVGMGLEIGGEEPFLKVPTISLKRAVSKIRFVFSQMYTENNTEEEYAIEKVVLNEGQIPMFEYVFASDAYRIQTDNYVSFGMEVNWPIGTTLAFTETPEIYSYAGQDGPSYEKLIKDGITAGELSHLGTFYLRESDKALRGVVHYSITKGEQTEQKKLPFNMANAGDFARNHTWTVYGYFIANRTLQLAVNALPWDKNNYTIRFDQSSLQVTQKFTVDPASATVVRIGNTNEYNVFLDPNKPARGYIYVTTPQGGTLQISPSGDAADVAAFDVKPESATIDPTYNSGRIDITIDRKESGVTGKTITLSFEAYTPDERKIAGDSECVDQIYHFHL